MKDLYDPVGTVARNLTALMAHEKDRKRSLWTAQAVAAKAEIGHGTVDRVAKGQTNVNIANLHAIAKVFGLRAWQLLVPDLQPDNPPVLRTVSPDEADLYNRLRELAKQIPDRGI